MNKAKEYGVDKHRRLDLGKPHIYWSGFAAVWLWSVDGEVQKELIRFCVGQDARWKPRSKT